MKNYHDHEMLKDFLLEESYVLSVDETDKAVRFRMLFALAESHAMSGDVKPGEQYSYRHGWIVFSEVSSLDWREKKLSPTTDLDGEIDFGNIEKFLYADGVYELSGQWGAVRIASASLKVTVDDT